MEEHLVLVDRSDEETEVAPDANSAPPAADPMSETYGPLQRAYDFFNARLFDGSLPGALITLRTERRTLGYFSSDRFGTTRDQRCDEIALNPQYFGVRPIENTLSTLVHEMVHQLRQRTGTPSRGRYHDAKWGTMMRERGLQPSTTGKPGGKAVGDRVTHYIVAGGPFEEACKELVNSDFRLTWFDRYPPQEAIHLIGVAITYPAGATEALIDENGARIEAPTPPPVTVEKTKYGSLVGELPGMLFGSKINGRTNKNKIKYTCGVCHANIWGKPGLSVLCGKDQCAFVPEATDDADEDASAN